MNLCEHYNALKKELSFVKKQMIFEFSQHLYIHYSIILCVKDNSLLIRTDNLKYKNMCLIDFFKDEFKNYHVHASLLFELSEELHTCKKSDYFELGTPYFLNFIDIF